MAKQDLMDGLDEFLITQKMGDDQRHAFMEMLKQELSTIDNPTKGDVLQAVGRILAQVRKMFN